MGSNGESSRYISPLLVRLEWFYPYGLLDIIMNPQERKIVLELLNELDKVDFFVPTKSQLLRKFITLDEQREAKFNKIKAMLKKDEGWRSKPYKDNLGVPTIGYGFNIRHWDKHGMAKDEGEALLDVKIAQCMREAILIPELGKLNEARQIVIINMLYQLGFTKVRMFKKMREALKAEDWEKASDEMLDSKWHDQTSERVDRLAGIMHEGKL